MRVALFSNVNLDIVLNDLAKTHEVFRQEGYGQWIQESIDPSGKLRAFNPECIFLIFDGHAIIDSTQELQNHKQELSNVLEYSKGFLNQFPLAQVFISNIDVRPLQISCGDVLPYEHTLLKFWEDGLSELLANSNMHLFQLRSMIEEFGRKNFYSDKMWYLGSIPYSVKGLAQIADHINETIKIYNFGSRKKVLVVDLDNTLWGGVVGEDGIFGITLSNSGTGAIYRDTQKRIKEIKNLGVLLAISSKSDMSDVLTVLDKHPHMLLKQDDFVDILANWDSKASNIKKMAEKIKLGLDSFVFLDDNPIERETIRIELPEVAVVDFPESVSNLPFAISKMARDYFFIPKLTTEDVQKTKQYQDNAMRQEMQSASTSIEGYLLSLDIKIKLFRMTEEQTERVAQLTQKTNQFNLLTTRFTIEELNSYSAIGENYVFVASVSDKFGDNGLVFVLMISVVNATATIDNLLMSCRVMGRQIEYAVLAKIEDFLKSKGVSEIYAKYIKTEKNTPVQNLMEQVGYELIDKDNYCKRYKRNFMNCTTNQTLLTAIMEDLNIN